MRPASFTEDLRYRYDGDLTPSSLVIDCGGFVGDFAAGIAERYDSWIEVYEPIQEYVNQMDRRFRTNKKIVVLSLAVSDREDSATLRFCTNSSGFYADHGPEQVVTTTDIFDVVDCRDVALLKLNIEGEEFPVLTRLLDTGLVRCCLNIQIQFHRCYPDAEAARERIRERLAETHEETWGDWPFVWENWRRRP